VHYFLHTGHLHIEGRKMSKSLKNFLTIREVLEQVTPRQLRLLFLMQSWRDPMNYSQGTLAEMLAKEKTIREFMLMVKTRLRDDMGSQHIAGQRWNTDDEEVHKAILETEKKARRPCRRPLSLLPQQLMLCPGARRAVRGREHAARAQVARGAHPHLQQVRPCAFVRKRCVTDAQVHHGHHGAPGLACKSSSSRV
jgi:cysteinyl-tRNA synthetase